VLCGGRAQRQIKAHRFPPVRTNYGLDSACAKRKKSDDRIQGPSGERNHSFMEKSIGASLFLLNPSIDECRGVNSRIVSAKGFHCQDCRFQGPYKVSASDQATDFHGFTVLGRKMRLRRRRDNPQSEKPLATRYSQRRPPTATQLKPQIGKHSKP
jgi:hypothetical protein